MKPISHKTFVSLFLSAITIFVLFNYLTWQFFLKDILSRENNVITGDLARIGYITDLVHPRSNSNTLKYRHLEPIEFKGQSVDIITIGDSFSEGLAGGENRFFQDYLASYPDMGVLNIPPSYPHKTNWLDMLLAFSESGFLEIFKPKYLLIESTQREMFRRFAVNYPANKEQNLKDILDHYKIESEIFSKRSSDKARTLVKETTILNNPSNDPFKLPDISFINNGNFKFWWNKLMYRFDNCAFISKTCRQQLNKNLFTINNGDEFLYYKDDKNSVLQSTTENIELINENLNKLSIALKDKNIRLIIMPIVSKYNLYQEYFNQKQDKDMFFELMRAQSKKYIFIDTKDLFRRTHEQGHKDIFFADDTHWTHHASEIVSKDIMKKISDSDN